MKKYKVYIKLSEFVMAIITIISPEMNVRIRYFKEHKKRINLENPSNFIEKLCYLKLFKYRDNELVKKCSDKIRVREYVKECGYEHLLNKIYYIYNDIKDINVNILPNKFVLKYNFGCGYNVICSDKSEFNLDNTINSFNKWKKEKCWLSNAEFQYKVNDKKIICEKYLEDGQESTMVDYKLYVFNGKVEAILVINDRQKNKQGSFYDYNWNYIGTPNSTYKKYNFNKPLGLKLMKECAEKLAQPFPFVRVDFYQTKDRVIFGEMTFTPAGAVYASNCKINDRDMGELLNIDVK